MIASLFFNVDEQTRWDAIPFTPATGLPLPGILDRGPLLHTTENLALGNHAPDGPRPNLIEPSFSELRLAKWGMTYFR